MAVLRVALYVLQARGYSFNEISEYWLFVTLWDVSHHGLFGGLRYMYSRLEGTVLMNYPIIGYYYFV